jgi:3-oxoadipate enol-lactonase
MGGQVGIWLGINARDRLDRLVLANTAARIGSAELWNARIDAVRTGGMASIAPAVLTRWFSQALMEQPTPIVAKMRATFEAMSAEAYASACAAVRDMDLRHALRRIHTPTLVIAGSDDVSTPPEEARYTTDHVENARYVELQSSHFSNILSAPAFTQAVVQFLTGRH